MSSPKQTTLRTVDEDGTIHVSTTDYLTEDISAFSIDNDDVRHYGFKTEADVRAAYNIPDEYETVGLKPNNWVQQDKEGPFIAHQMRGSFSPPKPGMFVLENLLEELKQNSPIVPRKIREYKPTGKERRMLEISIMDPHVGLTCFKGSSDTNYNLEIARETYLWAVTELAFLANRYEGVDEILFPVGNDFLHGEPSPMGNGRGATGNATSSGVPQPEMTDWYLSYVEGERMMREAISFLSTIAHVTVPVIMGNHDHNSTFTLGRVMNAYFHNDENVTIDCTPDPVKFKRYGCNLIGFEHGHAMAQVRLAAVMANERPKDWYETAGGYREWHLGDQHRKGSAKPSMLEEQGVSVEFLPSLVAPNAWHRMKSFNWQKRGAMAWVWDHDTGPVARLQVNLNSYTGKPMGK